MTKIAIDVVLAPPKAIIDFAIQKNKTLLTGSNDITILDEKTCVPHISLCMGAVEELKLKEIENELKKKIKSRIPLNLKGILVENHLLSNGKMAAGLKLENTISLKELHQEMMKTMWPYLSYDLDESMFFDPAKIDKITLELTQSYQQKHKDVSLFHPHITLGIGELPEEEVNLPFQANELSIFQLGNYCTCCKKLCSMVF